MPHAGRRQPIFNLPAIITAFGVLLVAVHGIRAVLPHALDVELLWYLAFIPARYGVGGDLGPQIWTFATYSFLHGDLIHLLVNLLWLAAFGPAVAWRLGPARFVPFCVASAVGAAALHLMTHAGEPVPMIGASGVISGLLAGAVRFAFRRGAPLGIGGRTDRAAYRQPAMSMRESFSDPRTLLFIGVWLAINLIFGTGTVDIAGDNASIAWQAHIGGFAAGLIVFSVLDPVGSARPDEEGPNDTG